MSVVLSSIRKDSIDFPGHFEVWSVREPIMIYLTVAGSVIPMRVMESESIASVKFRIQRCKGFVVKNQKLVFGGREMARDNSLVRDYGVSDGNVLHLVLRLSDLLIITVTTANGEEFELHVGRFRNVGYVKRKIAKKGKDLVGVNDEEEIFCNGERLDDDQRLIDDICNNSEAAIHLIVQKSAKVRAKPVEIDYEISVVASDEELECMPRSYLVETFMDNPRIRLPSFIWDLIKSTYDGLNKGNQPMRSSEGSGGAYFMPDSSGDKYISVFKPIDEEPLAVNNPQGLPISPNGEGLKRGTRVGEGALREVAAYILDHPKSGSGPRLLKSEEVGFAGVPPTVMVKCLHKGFNHPEGFEGTLKNVKIGSLQMFVKNQGSCEDMGPRDFPVEEVHKISVLDIRLANADRHAGNILMRREGEDGHIVLTPIDHGYCLPENFEDCTFDWLYWPQSRQPFTPNTIDYINSLDAEQDIALLRFYGWDLSLECARTLRISTLLLKKGAVRGLSPFAIGSIMCRETLNKESVIEKIVNEARDSVILSTSESEFLETVSRIMDHRLDEIAE